MNPIIDSIKQSAPALVNSSLVDKQYQARSITTNNTIRTPSLSSSAPPRHGSGPSPRDLQAKAQRSRPQDRLGPPIRKFFNRSRSDDKRRKQFKPLWMTVVGCAGTGKSILINTVVGYIRKIFQTFAIFFTPKYFCCCSKKQNTYILKLFFATNIDVDLFFVFLPFLWTQKKRKSWCTKPHSGWPKSKQKKLEFFFFFRCWNQNVKRFELQFTWKKNSEEEILLQKLTPISFFEKKNKILEKHQIKMIFS